MRNLVFSSLYLIMVIVLIHCKSDCDHNEIAKNIVNICKVYGVPSKREIKGSNNGLDRIRPIIQDVKTGETMTQYQYSAYKDGSPTVPVEGNPFLQWVSNNNPQTTPPPEFSGLSEHHNQRDDFGTIGLSNEPEDFASFNIWYLNPVYAEAEIEELSPMERLRRIRESDKIDILINTCCNTKTGCPFPDFYLTFARDFKMCYLY